MMEKGTTETKSAEKSSVDSTKQDQNEARIVQGESNDSDKISETEINVGKTDSGINSDIADKEIVLNEQTYSSEESGTNDGSVIGRLKLAMKDPKKRVALIFLGVVQIIFILYFLFWLFGSDKSKKDDDIAFRQNKKSYSENYDKGVIFASVKRP